MADPDAPPAAITASRWVVSRVTPAGGNQPRQTALLVLVGSYSCCTAVLVKNAAQQALKFFCSKKPPSYCQAPPPEQVDIGPASGQRMGRALAGDVATFRGRDRRLSVVSMLPITHVSEKQTAFRLELAVRASPTAPGPGRAGGRGGAPSSARSRPAAAVETDGTRYFVMSSCRELLW